MGATDSKIMKQQEQKNAEAERMFPTDKLVSVEKLRKNICTDKMRSFLTHLNEDGYA